MTIEVPGPGRDIVPHASAAYLASVERIVAQHPDFGANAERVLQAFGADGATTIVDLYARYDLLRTTEHRDGTTQTSPHHALERLFRVLPEYAKHTTEAGLDAERSVGLITALIGDERRSPHTRSDRAITLLGRALDWQQRHHGPLAPDDYAMVRGLIADTAPSGDKSALAVDSYRALSRLGVATADGIDFIRTDLYTNDRIMREVIPVANALSIADIDTAKFMDICRILISNEERPRSLEQIQQDMRMLRECIVTVVPDEDMPPAELLTMVYAKLSDGQTMDEVAQGFMNVGRLQQGADTGVYRSGERAAKHFIPIDGALELSPLPYRVGRSFEDGLRDMRRLALNTYAYDEVVSEGFWVFDSDASTWYSMGGKTQLLAPGSVRHTSPEYPMQELSRHPILAHCHPQEFEDFINTGAGSVFPKAAIPIMDRFLAMTPSRRDYGVVAELLSKPDRPESVRSVIAHGSGITEYTFPQDPEALEAMARDSRDLRDQFVLGINWDRTLYKRRMFAKIRRDNDEVARELLEQFNNRLPQGFGIRLLPQAE